MNNILLILAAVGMLLIIKYGFIFNAPREFIINKAFKINSTFGKYIQKLFSCSQCLGFWCGFILFLLTGILEHDYHLIIYYSILYGFITSLIGNVIDMLLTYLDEKIFSIQKENESKADKDNL
jgi:hypothetical protein